MKKSRLASSSINVYLLSLATSNILLYTHATMLWFIPVIFFLLLPGFLLLSIANKRLSNLSTLLVSLGMGLALTYVICLLLNSLHWIFGYSAPLSRSNIIIAFNAVIIAELLVAAKRRKIPSISNSLSSLNLFDLLTLSIVGIGFLLVSFSVNLLNNSGSSALQLATTVYAALIPLYIVTISKKVSQWSYVFGLVGTGAILLLQSSLRSRYLAGSDVLSEYHVFNIVSQHKYWSVSPAKDAYNACLSITVLPQALSAITGMSGLEVFRVVSQVIFSFASVVVYSIGALYLPRIRAFFAGIAFLSFQDFITSMPGHVRQEIALLLFCLIIYVALSNEISERLKKSLILMFGVSMVVSHYSTAYVAIILFLGAYLVQKLLHHNKRLRVFEKGSVYLITPAVLAILSLFTILWFSQIALTSGGPITYASQTLTKILSGRIDNEQASQTSLGSQFSFGTPSQDNQQLFKQYLTQNNLNTNNTQNYSVTQQNTPVSSAHFKPLPINTFINELIQIFKKIYKLIILLGIVAPILWVKRNDDQSDVRLVYLTAGCALTIVASFLIPSFTVDYDQERMFQQILPILAVASMIGISLLSIKTRILNYGIAIFLGIYILISSGFLGELAGGWDLALQYNNFGIDYGRFDVHAQEVLSAEWISSENKQHKPIYSDTFAAKKILFATTSTYADPTLLPSNFHGNYFVYYDYPNATIDQTYQPYGNGTLVYNPPTNYLRSNNSLVYDNGGSKIYEK